MFIVEYLKLSGSNLKIIFFGLCSGIIASYYNVYVNEFTGLIIQGDFSNECLYNLYYTSLLAIIFTSLRGALFTYSQKNMNTNIRILIYKKLLFKPSTFYETTPISTLHEYINNDVNIVSNIISLNMNVFMRSTINIIITLYLLYNISFKLCILVVFIIGFNLIISFLYNKYYKYLMKDFEDNNKKLHIFINETISHILMLKTFAVEDLAIIKHSHLSKNVSYFFIYESYLYAINAFIIFNMPVITMIIIILYAKYFNLTTGLISFILHYKSLFTTVNELLEVKNELTKCFTPYDRIMKLLNEDLTTSGYYIPDNNQLVPLITFENIVFQYKKALKPIIQNFNFTIQPYDKIAIIGSSGCGKSTIVKLLVGILANTNGTIFINNIDINHYNNKWLKNKIGYVAQETILFTDTIANNIAYGLDNYDYNDIKKAAIMANADEFIDKLDNKYETIIEGTEMSSLSGGQKQRISIARALIRKPQIIIFDEATSALDPYCEEVVQQTIKNCFKTQNATMIVIAHHKSAFEMVNTIYKLENSELSIFDNQNKNK